MTNTKFRKRALLSSVAMLLVALVALGSATFAWFVANPTVTASGAKMQVLAAPGLKIASESDYVKGGKVSYTFGSSANLTSLDFTLQPASPYLEDSDVDALDYLQFASIKALRDDQYGRNTSDTFTAVNPATVTGYTAAAGGNPESWTTTTNAGDVYYEDLYFQKSGEGSEAVTIKAVAVNIDSVSGEIPQGVKVALVAQIPGDTATYQLLGVWKATGGQDTHTWAGATNNSAISADAATYVTNAGTVKNLAIPVNNAAAGSGATIRAYVYLDGENQYTTSSRATNMTQLVNSLTIKVSTENSNISFT